MYHHTGIIIFQLILCLSRVGTQTKDAQEIVETAVECASSMKLVSEAHRAFSRALLDEESTDASQSSPDDVQRDEKEAALFKSLTARLRATDKSNRTSTQVFTDFQTASAARRVKWSEVELTCTTEANQARECVASITANVSNAESLITLFRDETVSEATKLQEELLRIQRKIQENALKAKVSCFRRYLRCSAHSRC